MRSYGQYCPVAVAAEVLGDRWTILIVRELLNGARRFAEIERGLPGIPRAVLAKRLVMLADRGLLRRSEGRPGYELTAAGEGLRSAIDGLGEWAARFSFGDPPPETVRPDLLLWWVRRRLHREKLPPGRTVIRVELRGRRATTRWLLIDRGEAEVCVDDPGGEADLVLRADTIALHQVFGGRLALTHAMRRGQVELEGPRALARAFTSWLGLSPYAETVAASRAR